MKRKNNIKANELALALGKVDGETEVVATINRKHEQVITDIGKLTTKDGKERLAINIDMEEMKHATTSRKIKTK